MTGKGDHFVMLKKESPSDGGAVKGAALSTEKQDINLEDIILWFVNAQIYGAS